jgi:hypothetical protein
LKLGEVGQLLVKQFQKFQLDHLLKIILEKIISFIWVSLYPFTLDSAIAGE